MPDRDPWLSVVVPAYNEELRIVSTLEATDRWLKGHADEYEILVVDDGSTDDTREAVRAVARELPAVHLIAGWPNRGKGYAVRRGMLTARGKLRLFMDADNATPISELPGLLEHIRDGAQVVIGSRRAPGAKVEQSSLWYRRLWSHLASRVVRAQLLPGIQDTQCGFKLFTASAAIEIFRSTQVSGWAFDLEALAIANMLGYRIDEVPVRWRDGGRSKTRIGDTVRITREFLRVRQTMELRRVLPRKPAV